MSNKTNRSNAYRRGWAAASHCALQDNPYRKGTKQWHQWRKGILDSAKDFASRLILNFDQP